MRARTTLLAVLLAAGPVGFALADREQVCVAYMEAEFHHEETVSALEEKFRTGQTAYGREARRIEKRFEDAKELARDLCYRKYGTGCGNTATKQGRQLKTAVNNARLTRDNSIANLRKGANIIATRKDLDEAIERADAVLWRAYYAAYKGPRSEISVVMMKLLRRDVRWCREQGFK